MEVITVGDITTGLGMAGADITAGAGITHGAGTAGAGPAIMAGEAIGEDTTPTIMAMDITTETMEEIMHIAITEQDVDIITTITMG